MNPWPHQSRAILEIEAAIADEGIRRIALSIPTGGGKTLVMELLAKAWLAAGMRVVLYSDRKRLIEQLSANLAKAGMLHGIRAAGHDDERELPFQIASMHTMHSRAMKRRTEKLHRAHRVLVDEAGAQIGPTAMAILNAHVADGAFVVGFDATPFDLGCFYEKLIVCGTVSELRACGALVPAIYYGPDEPDMKAFKGLMENDLPSGPQAAKAMAPKRVFGRVWDHYEAINPTHRPALLFAPGVEESIWYAERFTSKGVRAAHVDGDNIWLDGELRIATPDLWKELLSDSESGRIGVLCNRFVCRRGIDAPWLSHGILATVFGSLESYLQSVGRFLRGYPGIDHVTIQDHGGNWWRLGSANEDREWFLDVSADMARDRRADAFRKKQAAEPFRCPRCGRIWTAARECSTAKGGCGFVFVSTKHSRPVITIDGTLREMHGPLFRPRTVCAQPGGLTLWIRMYWRSRKGARKMTFRQAAALFAIEWAKMTKGGCMWPDPQWPLMPTAERDWYRLVADVPMDRLTSVPTPKRARNGEGQEQGERRQEEGTASQADRPPRSGAAKDR